MEGREGVAVSGSEVGGGGGGGGGGAGGGGGGGGGGKESQSPSPSLTPSPPAASGGSGMGVTVPHAVGMGMGMGMGIGMGMGMSSSSGEDLARKKRGRPRKYGPDDVGGGMALALVPASSSPFSSYSFSGSRRGRGRPPGSGRRQLLATLGEWFAYSAGGNFTPHVVTVATGEDVAARILSFSQKGPRAICILSANGAISNVTLRQPGSSGGTLTYEGRFEILSLSGSFTISEGGGVRSRTGGISVSLAGPDGRVVGGGVAGSLLAASPIQVVVGSFLPNALKEPKRKSDPESSSYTAVPSPSILTAVRPVSQATPADEREPPTPTPMTLPVQIRGGAENSTSSSLNPSSSSFRAAGWQGLQSSSSSDHRASPDINICLPGE